MAKYKTAMGRVVDMAALAAKNEKTRAIGNMKVNARGDTIDNMGRVIQSATTKVNEAYSKTVGNRSAQVQRTHPNRKTVQTPPPQQPKNGVNAKVEEPLTEIERELEASLEDDLEVEKIKAKEVGKKK